tara:strand:- start:7575 stop:8507 length:933 start_codon:yes stop_codon:yes gene_type:complete
MLRMVSFSRSKNYTLWIKLATLCLMVLTCYAFYVIIVRYLKWKSSQLPKESFIGQLFDTSPTNIAIVSMIKDPKNIDTWFEKHKELGIKHFYIRLEETPELAEYLEKRDDVTLQLGQSTGVNEYDEKQVRQDKWVNEALQLAQTDKRGIKWMVHLDGDELLHGDLTEIQELPDDVHTFWMNNEEAKFNHVPNKKDNCFSASKMAKCSKGEGCVSYGNGKGGCRVGSDIKSYGPHRMKSSLEKNGGRKLNKLVVQHYESCDFDIFKKKFKQLAVQDKKLNIPFSYYNESIDAAKNNDEEKLYKIYEKYRVE